MRREQLNAVAVGHLTLPPAPAAAIEFSQTLALLCLVAPLTLRGLSRDSAQSQLRLPWLARTCSTVADVSDNYLYFIDAAEYNANYGEFCAQKAVFFPPCMIGRCPNLTPIKLENDQFRTPHVIFALPRFHQGIESHVWVLSLWMADNWHQKWISSQCCVCEHPVSRPCNH